MSSQALNTSRDGHWQSGLMFDHPCNAKGGFVCFMIKWTSSCFSCVHWLLSFPWTPRLAWFYLLWLPCSTGLTAHTHSLAPLSLVRNLLLSPPRNACALLCCSSSTNSGGWSLPWGPELANVIFLLLAWRPCLHFLSNHSRQSQLCCPCWAVLNPRAEHDYFF